MSKKMSSSVRSDYVNVGKSHTTIRIPELVPSDSSNDAVYTLYDEENELGTNFNDREWEEVKTLHSAERSVNKDQCEMEVSTPNMNVEKFKELQEFWESKSNGKISRKSTAVDKLPESVKMESHESPIDLMRKRHERRLQYASTPVRNSLQVKSNYSSLILNMTRAPSAEVYASDENKNGKGVGDTVRDSKLSETSLNDCNGSRQYFPCSPEWVKEVEELSSVEKDKMHPPNPNSKAKTYKVNVSPITPCSTPSLNASTISSDVPATTPKMLAKGHLSRQKLFRPYELSPLDLTPSPSESVKKSKGRKKPLMSLDVSNYSLLYSPVETKMNNSGSTDVNKLSDGIKNQCDKPNVDDEPIEDTVPEKDSFFDITVPNISAMKITEKESSVVDILDISAIKPPAEGDISSELLNDVESPEVVSTGCERKLPKAVTTLNDSVMSDMSSNSSPVNPTVTAAIKSGIRNVVPMLYSNSPETEAQQMCQSVNVESDDIETVSDREMCDDNRCNSMLPRVSLLGMNLRERTGQHIRNFFNRRRHDRINDNNNNNWDHVGHELSGDDSGLEDDLNSAESSADPGDILVSPSLHPVANSQNVTLVTSNIDYEPLDDILDINNSQLLEYVNRVTLPEQSEVESRYLSVPVRTESPPPFLRPVTNEEVYHDTPMSPPTLQRMTETKVLDTSLSPPTLQPVTNEQESHDTSLSPPTLPPLTNEQVSNDTSLSPPTLQPVTEAENITQNPRSCDNIPSKRMNTDSANIGPQRTTETGSRLELTNIEDSPQANNKTNICDSLCDWSSDDNEICDWTTDDNEICDWTTDNSPASSPIRFPPARGRPVVGWSPTFDPSSSSGVLSLNNSAYQEADDSDSSFSTSFDFNKNGWTELGTSDISYDSDCNSRSFQSYDSSDEKVAPHLLLLRRNNKRRRCLDFSSSDDSCSESDSFPPKSKIQRTPNSNPNTEYITSTPEVVTKGSEPSDDRNVRTETPLMELSTLDESYFHDPEYPVSLNSSSAYDNSFSFWSASSSSSDKCDTWSCGSNEDSEPDVTYPVYTQSHSMNESLTTPVSTNADTNTHNSMETQTDLDFPKGVLTFVYDAEIGESQAFLSEKQVPNKPKSDERVSDSVSSQNSKETQDSVDTENSIQTPDSVNEVIAPDSAVYLNSEHTTHSDNTESSINTPDCVNIQTDEQTPNFVSSQNVRQIPDSDEHQFIDELPHCDYDPSDEEFLNSVSPQNDEHTQILDPQNVPIVPANMTNPVMYGNSGYYTYPYMHNPQVAVLARDHSQVWTEINVGSMSYAHVPSYHTTQYALNCYNNATAGLNQYNPWSSHQTTLHSAFNNSYTSYEESPYSSYAESPDDSFESSVNPASWSNHLTQLPTIPGITVPLPEHEPTNPTDTRQDTDLTDTRQDTDLTDTRQDTYTNYNPSDNNVSLLSQDMPYVACLYQPQNEPAKPQSGTTKPLCNTNQSKTEPAIPQTINIVKGTLTENGQPENGVNVSSNNADKDLMSMMENQVRNKLMNKNKKKLGNVSPDVEFTLSDGLRNVRPYIISGWLSSTYLMALAKKQDLVSDMLENPLNDKSEVCDWIIENCRSNTPAIFARDLLFRMFTLGELENLNLVKLGRTKKYKALKRAVEKQFPGKVKRNTWEGCCRLMKSSVSTLFKHRVGQVQAFLALHAAYMK